MRFLMEKPFIHSVVTLALSFLWVWIVIRLFVVTKEKPDQVGDPSPAFALSSFVPERYAT